MKYTVIGGQGFIGSHIVELLKEYGHDVWVPEKGSDKVFNSPLGIVIYAAGYGDCENDPLKVYHSNLSYLVEVIEKASFERFIYISSTRVYMNQQESIENSDVKLCFNDNRALFNLTKLTAENIVLSKLENAVVVRPSNVYGLALNSPLFLPSIVKHAVANGEVNMYVSKNYSKDYVAVSDVANVIIKLSTIDCDSKIYNIASGKNVTAGEIAGILEKNTGCEIIWHDIISEEKFPETNIQCVKKLCHFEPRNVLDDLSSMIEDFYKESQLSG